MFKIWVLAMAMSNAEKLRNWRKNNPDKVRAQKARHKERHPNAAKEYRERTKEKAAEYRLTWQRKHKEKVRQRCKVWREANPDKNRAKAMRYRANKIQRTVDWDKELTELVEQEASDLCLRREQLTGQKWHVDHIIPLCGKNVSGLHVWNNLAVLPASVNIGKNNKYVIQ